MFCTLHLVFIFFNFIYLVRASNLYGPHPRIVSNNGNLVIYAADHKNVSIRTTGRGYINLNDENLIPLLKNARNASLTVDRLTSNIIGPLSSSLQSISDLIYGPDGILKRVSTLETNSTGIVPLRPGIMPPRNRNWLQLNRRVRTLETNMIRVLNLLKTNECESNPCKNGGECIDMYNGYMCRCLDSWTGASCETDVNECLKYHGTDLGCQNGATCMNKQGSYECICAAGWFGLHCNRRTQDCNTGSPQELCGHGTCVSQNTATGYTCICDQGWTTNNISPACTVDVNECESMKTPVCSTNPPVQCINVPGTFYCGSCPAGYSGNGFSCVDIDECLNNNGGCSNIPKVQCINTMGSRMCGACPPGYIGDGISCSFQGVCRINNGGCHPLARCLDNPSIGDSYVQCICPSGYSGTGMGTNGCYVSALTPVITSCSSNPCVHGICVSNSNNSFTCSCHPGYTGITCSSTINPCDSNPCKNGATCTNTGSTYSCECTTGYTGLNCDKERQACGGKLTGESGFLQFPAANNSNYEHSISCSWLIQTKADHVLNISFTKFHLEPPDNNNNCVYDWVQMHDGSNSASLIIGRFCGLELPKGGQITTTHNSLYLWFRSDHTVSSPGFALKWKTIKPLCGGPILVESHGTLNSPGAPGNYPPNRDCYWMLIAPLGKRIQFHFFMLNIGNNQNCSNDYLELTSGDTLIAKFCNSTHPEPVISDGSVVNVHFHSDASGSYPGFQISYSVIEGIPGCGGLFTGDRGEFGSPVLDEQYQSNSNCEYKIKLPENSRIKITFLSFSVEDSLGCQFDYVAIHEGGRPDSPLVGRYCGSNIPPSYISLGNELYIRFKTDRYINDDGFRIRYEIVCVNILDAPSGIITSAGYPKLQTSIRNCLYEIRQKPGTAIKLTFQDVNVGVLPCHFDYIEVRDGDSDNSTLITKFCGRTIPEEIISTHNYLRIKMIVRTTNVYTGFKANYSTIDIRCGGILRENLGIIKSPENPNYYPPNTKCTWVISASPGFVIQLTWVVFNMEWSSSCNADYVSVYENNTATGNSSLIGKYCGRKLPPTSVSTTNVVSVYFISDQSQNYDGFIVNYNFLDESKTCGGNYFVSTGVIKSPNYPSQYPAHKDCVWVITVPHGQQIMLHVEDFDLEAYLHCASDFLEIRNGAYSNSPLIGTYCGKDIPKSIPSHTNSLYLRFRSDSTLGRSGFKITWDGTATGCGGTLSSPTGQIISPNYPQPYGQNAMCLWKIATSAGSVLQLMFLDISLESQIMCRIDYVEIYDGLDFASKSLGRFCSDSHPAITLKTSSNRALVKFRSDVSHEERGFVLKYSTLCNNVITGYRGVIESLNFPNPYPKNQNCTWTIQVPAGNKVNISFSHFDVEVYMNSKKEKVCKFDYLQIIEHFDDYEPDEVILPKTCGKELPPNINSTKNTVKINFVTDSIFHNTGFRLEWVVEGCSGYLTHPEGRIATPGYPNGYPTDTVCEWIIQVDFDSAVELKVEKFDFEYSMGCSYDSLQIFNGPNENAPLLSKVCNVKEDGFVTTTTSNIMLVKFTSDSSYTGKGFEAYYKTVPAKCGGKYTAPLGSIHSRNYPKNYQMRDDCEWLIEIDKNHVVELQFHEFDLVTTRNCTSDYLQIYDGNSTNAPLLQTLCGGQEPNGTIKSSTNTLYVRMVTGTRGTAKGFLANYTLACGSRIVTSTNGMIDIADWGTWECSWTIMADTPEKHVSLSITHLDISSNCDTKSLHIYDGTSAEAPLIGSYCGTKAPATIVSKGSALFIDLNYAYGAYIRGTYSVISTDCGGTLTSVSGYFGSVGYPNNYPMNADCQWTIRLAPGNKIVLTFLEFDLITSENCNADYVEVREKDASGKLLGIFCGNTIPTNITQTNSLWIEFKSSDIGTAKGFLAEYVLSHGNELFGSKGEIASPLYPLTYGQSDEVYWRITVDFNSVILITFKDFQADWYSGSECYFIGLEIYDGYDATSPVIASLCSLGIPEPVRTTSNVAYIRYYVGSYRYTVKFYLEWLQVQKIVNTKNITKNFSVEGCGSDSMLDITTLSTYDIESPGFPNGYAGHLNCEWLFSTTPENHLFLQFTAMDLEATDPRCLFDNVKIYSGEDYAGSNWKLKDTYCLSNSTSLDFIHTTNLMKVVFKTDAYIYDGYDTTSPVLASLCSLEPEPVRTSSNVAYIRYIAGSYRYIVKFYLEWLQVKKIVNTKNITKNFSVEGCGSDSMLDITTLSTYDIESPGFPNGYAGHLNCEWLFSTTPENHLFIHFTAMDLEATDPRCLFDNVKIYSGEDYAGSNWKLKDTYCLSNSTSLDYIHTTNLMKVVFKSDAYVNKTGFSATIYVGCGGNLTGPNGVIDMKNYNSSLRARRTKCEWSITVKAGRTIQITFTDFDIPSAEENICSDNYILLKNGRYQESPLLDKGKYCGTTIPVVNQTTGNSIYIKYFGLAKVKGFRLLYKEVSLACGGHISLTDTYKSVNISSPNYPEIPPPHTECIWIISAPSGESLQLDFIERFDISYSADCIKEGVEIRDGGTAMSNLIDIYCYTVPSTQKTTDNLMYVRFFTDIYEPKNGFKATVSIATCGGTIRAKTGKLTSPYYSVFHTFPVNTICTWKIIGPHDHYLNISFKDFKFVYKANCSTSNHLLITEKLPWGNETTLATLCGSKTPADIRTSSNEVTIQMKILLPNRMTKGFSLVFNTSQEACGGTIEADSGIITSPGYPVSNHYNRNCEWYIIVPEGRRVTAKIIDFDFAAVNNYYVITQGLAFYNSKDYRSGIVLYKDASEQNRVIKSTTNEMVIYFWSAGRFNNRGFKLSFNSDEATICTGDLSKESGIIRPPERGNLTSYYCKWIRRPQGELYSHLFNTSSTSALVELGNGFPRETLAIIVDTKEIGKFIRKNCKYAASSINVYSDVNPASNEPIKELCGTFTEPQIILNPYPITKLTVRQAYVPILNYTISYKVHPCGGILTSSSGIISSPNYPNPYTGTIRCAWLIKLEEGQSIKLNFTTMELDPSCSRHYIEIYNGPTPTSPKIGRYCGTKHPDFVHSQANALWIEYHSLEGAVGKGFSLFYNPLTAGCGGIFHDKTRNIETPNYPVAYPNNIECIWEIRVDDGYHIGLQFINRFHIEKSTNCTNDYVEVQDYEDDTWVSFGKYCGRDEIPAFNSSTNRLRVIFRSNDKIQGSGFTATWNLNCGGTFIASETPKYLISPGYPIGYTQNLDCKYRITAPKKYVNIIFEDFLLESGKGSQCSFDNVTIGRQRYLGSPWHHYGMGIHERSENMYYINMGVYCGHTIPPPFRRQDEIRIWFRTDRWVDRKGFKLKYFIDSCGGRVTEEKEISSPQDLTGKSNYYSSVNCMWNITAPKDKVVIVRFTFFEMEHHRNCLYDNVALYDGNTVNMTERLALLCGNITNNIPVVRSSGNNMLVVMKTDASNHFRGFKAYVLFMYNEKVGCGGTVNLTDDQQQKVLRSPDIQGSGQYESNLDCHWLIVAPADETIELTFSSFHLSPCNTTDETKKCSCDFLQIRDGGGPLAELMAQPCGHNIPLKITSSGHLLWIRMVTDGVQSSSGFRATVKKVPSICGQTVLHVTENKQILTSPGFPENYPNNVRCVWTIRSNSTLTRLEIHFDHLEIQDSDREDRCSFDKLEISDKSNMQTLSEGFGEKFVFSGPKSMTNILGIRMPATSFSYCGSGKPPDYHSVRNEIVVSFTTDANIVKKGFQLDYRTAGCNRNYTEVQGRLLNEGMTKECIIRISAPTNHTISLYFQSFFYQNCRVSGLEIHDGNSSSAPRLVKLCGYQLPNPVFSTGNEIWMKIATDKRGFGVYDIIYTTTNQGRACGGEIYNYQGTFTSPMYPGNYRNNSVCRWNLAVPRGLRVALKFIAFDLGPINTCATDYIELIDVNMITKEEITRSRYCSSDNPAIFFATTNYMAVRYVTSTNNAGSGWVALFTGKEQLSSNSTL